MTKARDLSKLADGTEFTPADHSKLNAIEASSDVTDATNVTAAGALMDSELTNLAAVKAINQSLVTTAAPTFAGLATTANVGIGTSSPARLAEIYGTTNPALRLNNGTANVDIGIATSSGALLSGSSANDLVIARNGAYNIKLGTNGTTRMTLDASGNVLVGTNDDAAGAGNSTTGISLRGGTDNRSFFSVNQSYVMHLNRKGNDGDILKFAKDGGTVGSIGSVGGSLYIEGNPSTSKTGLTFFGASIEPRDAGSSSNGGVDLGASGSRFKDAYLSGGVYLGGTGSANKLDDYETGTFQMTMVGVSGGAKGKGLYVKIGNLVHFQWYSTTVTVSGSATPALTGLPFTAIDPINAGAYPTFVSSHNNYVSNSSSGYINLGTTSLYFTTDNSSGGTVTQAGSRYVMVSGTYYAS